MITSSIYTPLINRARTIALLFVLVGIPMDGTQKRKMALSISSLSLNPSFYASRKLVMVLDLEATTHAVLTYLATIVSLKGKKLM